MTTRSVRTLLAPRSLAFVFVAMCAMLACSSRTGFREDDRRLDLVDAGDVDAAPPVCGIHCSRDLKQVLDGCEGAETVIATCNPDQGCGDGRCVDACTAAVLTKGSAGCDFWTVGPTDDKFLGGCFAVLVANTWDREVSLRAGFGADVLDISKSTYLVARRGDTAVHTPLEGPLAPGQVAVVFLAHNPALVSPELGSACPADVTPAIPAIIPRHGTTRNRAFHIATDAPVSAYSIAPYGGAPSYYPAATLLLPSSSWTTSQLAVQPFAFSLNNHATTTRRTLQIVAAEDDTEVTIRPTSKILRSWEVEGTEADTIKTWTLAKGEVLQLVQVQSLTGSPVASTKPVALFGGSELIYMPEEGSAGDWLQQQIPPLSHWGTEYAVVPYLSRIESLSGQTREPVPYSIVAAAEGTVLSYEPSRPRNAPEVLGAGESADFVTDEVFVVKSQDATHPFHVSVYMTGGNNGAGTGAVTLGDPDWVNLPPTGQYLDRYVFFTDYTYPDTSLTLVRKKTPNGFMPVELECAGEIGEWKPIGAEYEYAWVRLTRGFVGQTFAKGTCSYGRQEAHSTGPFAITVWGIGAWASYGYVGGTGLRPINDLPPPVLK